mgnify:CR=1 FL=1
MGYLRMPEHGALSVRFIRQWETYKESNGHKSQEEKKKSGKREQLRTTRQVLLEVEQSLEKMK